MKIPSLGSSIAFGSLCFSAAILEVYDKPVGGLWFIIVVWAIFGEFK